MDVRVLDESDADRVRAICARNPVTHCFVASRVDAGVLSPAAPGECGGYPASNPRALLHVGTNCVPVDMDAAARAAFVEHMGRHRPFVSIVGEASQALDLHTALVERWGRPYADPREMRPRQPLMTTRQASTVAADPRLQPMEMRWFDSYFAAAVDMYTEELGESPLVTNPVGYRTYVSTLIQTQRAFGIVEDDEVIFKADVGVVGAGVAQVQGVWVKPSLRGRGVSAPAMAALTNRLVARGLVAALYVNDFNTRAIATYRRCGYETVGTFASVLF